MLLTKPAVLRARDEGRLRIDPFVPENIGSNSVDVRLGHWVFRQSTGPMSTLLNPWNRGSVEQHWRGPFRLSSTASLVMQGVLRRQDVAPFTDETEVLLLAPGECVLAHTIEAVGGLDLRITAKMQARSSIGRSNITVCACAGLGDIGFNQRWTMEIRNCNPHSHVLLPVGGRVAQIVLFEGEAVAGEDAYRGKYQDDEPWRPSAMLPAAYKDREFGTEETR